MCVPSFEKDVQKLELLNSSRRESLTSPILKPDITDSSAK